MTILWLAYKGQHPYALLVEIEGGEMQKYECSICGYIYDPAKGDPDTDIPPGTAFEDLPDDWYCPDCGAEKDMFDPYED